MKRKCFNIIYLNRLNDCLNSKWYKDNISSINEKIITINVGGQIYQTTIKTLNEDPDSLLSKLCDDNNYYFKKENDGSYYIQRDWWLFRYVLNYLRTKELPNKKETLLQLYNEATYFKLKTLQSDIYYKLNSNKIPEFEPISTISSLYKNNNIFSLEYQKQIINTNPSISSTWSITR